MTTVFEHTTHQLPRLEPRHLKVTGSAPAFGFEPCEDVGCTVGSDGTGSSCGRPACPACGCGGTNLSTFQLVDSEDGIRARCTCGYSWVRGAEHGHAHPGVLLAG